MAGRCTEGLDCKYSHPSAVDEVEPVEISETSTNPYFAGGLSPSSPIQYLPTPRIMLQPPPVREHRRPSARSQARKMARAKHDKEHLLSGSTLLPVKPSQDEWVNVKLPAPSCPPLEKFVSQPILRPLSTPPSSTATGFKIVRVSPYIARDDSAS